MMSTILRTLTAAAVVAVAGGATASDTGPAMASRKIFVTEQLPDAEVVLHATGERVMINAESRWNFMCGTDESGLTVDDLQRITEAHKRSMAEERILVDSGTRTGGIDIQYDLPGSLPAAAVLSFELAETYLEELFHDPITVRISVSWQNLGGGILGGTSSFYISPSWAIVRDGLQADMDSDDTLQAFLPAGSTIPVRYNASGTNFTNENRVFLTRSNFRAGVGTTNGRAADFVLNSAFGWDFDPRNGIISNRYSMVDVIVHETGHALGFASGVDFRNGDIEGPDIARFQRTDGTGDYNPDTTAEFQTTPRTVDFNNLNDDVNTDLISVEYRMSDGSPWQASHFREQAAQIGQMDPAISPGQTLWPDLFMESDIMVFDFIGYDFYTAPPCRVDFNNDGVLDFFDVSFFLVFFGNGDLLVDLNGDGVLDFFDVSIFLQEFSAGCP